MPAFIFLIAHRVMSEKKAVLLQQKPLQNMQILLSKLIIFDINKHLRIY